MQMINMNRIEQNLNVIPNLRGDKRKTAITTATKNLYNYLKSMNYGVIDRNFLNSFFSEKVSQRTRQNVLKVILNELLLTKRIQKTKKYKTIIFFRTSTLFTNDYGSYNVLMKKNGYKTKHYIYKKEKDQPPKRVLIGVSGINEESFLGEIEDFAEQTSDIPRRRQGVYSPSSLSIRIVKQVQITKGYEVL